MATERQNCWEALKCGKEAVCPGICAKFVFRCLSCIRLTPAFYIQAPNFAAEIQLQTNRFVFELPCAGLPIAEVPPPPMFVFSDAASSEEKTKTLKHFQAKFNCVALNNPWSVM